MIRLFANISAGHIIILSLISLIFMAQSGLGNIAAWSLFRGCCLCFVYGFN